VVLGAIEDRAGNEAAAREHRATAEAIFDHLEVIVTRFGARRDRVATSS
jgi:hypothetical protein